MVPVPLLPLPEVALMGPAKASLLASVKVVVMLPAAARVGMTLKLSPAARPPPFNARLKPSITGAGSAFRSKLPMSVPSERRTLYWLALVNFTS
ncbi:hypothetical protein D3C76_1369770 [compost metagenome]